MTRCCSGTSPSSASTSAARRAFREAGIAARIKYPNVVTVYDVLSSGDLVMEYRGGPTLAALLRRGRSLRPSIVAALGQQLLAALQAVHAAGVVHCDVKPANLVVSDDGRLVLIDFGIAEIEGATPAHAARRRGYVVGSPASWPPSSSAVRPRLPPATSGRSARPSTPQSKADSPSRRMTPSRTSPRSCTTRRRRPGTPVASSRSARLLVKDPGGRPSHPAVHALLTEAGPAPGRRGRGRGRRERSARTSASLVALAHGTNDAQKTMGVITRMLITAGLLPAHAAPPLWVITAAGLAIAVGTATGGWRIIRTLGHRISDIESPQGFAAESASTAVILSSAHLGFALSTTQVVSRAVVGSAAARRAATVHWRVAARVATAWLLTLPGAALVGAFAARVSATGTAGIVLVAGLLSIGAALIYGRSRRTRVTAATVNDSTLRPVPVPA